MFRIVWVLRTNPAGWLCFNANMAPGGWAVYSSLPSDEMKSFSLSPELTHTRSRCTLSDYHTLQSATPGPIKDWDTPMARVARGLWNDRQSGHEQQMGFPDLPGRTWMILQLKSREQVPEPLPGVAVQFVTWILGHSALTGVDSSVWADGALPCLLSQCLTLCQNT